MSGLVDGGFGAKHGAGSGDPEDPKRGTKERVIEPTIGVGVTPDLGIEAGTQLQPGDWLGLGMGRNPDGSTAPYLVDQYDYESADIGRMLSRDYKAKQIQNVLALPILSATHQIVPAKGDKGEAKWLQSYWDTDKIAGGCKTSLEQIIALMTSGFYLRHAYFEKVFAQGVGEFEGKVVYYDVAWRPQLTCRLMRDMQTGEVLGFEQQRYGIALAQGLGLFPVKMPNDRAFIYTHGDWIDPIRGTSDLEIAYWAWQTKERVLLLWFDFLQGVSLPRVIVKASTPETAQSVANEIAALRSSGVIPISSPSGPASIDIQALDLAGQGADQFMKAITWLDQAATQSVLAGFLDLTASAANGAGSYALSKDASDFFLQALEAKTRGMERQLREQVFAPLIRANFGPKAVVPLIQFEPLSAVDTTVAVELLQSAMREPPGGVVPASFIAELARRVGVSLGMDGDQLATDFTDSFHKAAAAADEQQALMRQNMLADKQGSTARGAALAQTPPGPAAQPTMAGQVAGVRSVVQKAGSMLTKGGGDAAS